MSLALAFDISYCIYLTNFVIGTLIVEECLDSVYFFVEVIYFLLKIFLILAIYQYAQYELSPSIIERLESISICPGDVILRHLKIYTIAEIPRDEAIEIVVSESHAIYCHDERSWVYRTS